MDFDFREYRPAMPLGAFVEAMWLTLAEGPLYRRLRVLPQGRAIAFFDLGAPQGAADPRSGAVATCRRAWVCGPRTRPLTVVAGADHRLLGVRFRPAGAAPFFGVPVSEVSDEVVELDELWGGFAAEVAERLAEAPVGAAFSVVETALLVRAGGEVAPEPLLDEAIRRLGNGEGPARIGRVAAELGVTLHAVVMRPIRAHRRMKRASTHDASLARRGFWV